MPIQLMGPYPTSPIPATSRSPPSEFGSSEYRIYASFCGREETPYNRASIWIECYDPSTNIWTHVSSIPGLANGHVLKGFAMVSVGDVIFIIGGRLCRKEMAHVSDDLADLVDVEVNILSSVYSYNVRTGEWSNLACLRFPRSDFACTVCDGKIYVAGGLSSLACARGISSGEVYDPDLDEWMSLPHMNTLRYKCVGVACHGKIHVVGGFAERLNAGPASPFRTERSSAEVFDPHTGRWQLMAQMWQLDVPPNQIVAVNGRLFSSGDCLKTWKGHIESYDANLNMWNEVDHSCLRTLADAINPTNDQSWLDIQELYLTMAPIKSQLFFLGGYKTIGEPSRTVSMACVFDTLASSNTDAWRSFEPTEEEREKELCSHCCVVQLS